MKNPVAIISALGLGAGLMYFFDPNRGKRRRALVRDQAVHLSKTANRELNRTVADVRNRANGVLVETEKLFKSETVTDQQLEGRVRTQLGRLSNHPHAIKTSVENGKVTLSGLILTDEVESVLNGIASVWGVQEIENKLEVHETAEQNSSLQGNNRVERQNIGWSPKTRALAATAGGGLALLAVAKRNTLNSILSSVGVGLVARSVINKPLSKLIATNGEKAIEIHKTITIDAPCEKVFEVLKYPQYFPYFMSHVQKVEPIGEKQYLWTVDGIVGKPVEWTAKITEVVPNESIKWEHTDGRIAGQTGVLRLEPINGSATRLQVDMKFPLIVGKLGNFVAGVFNRDPKSKLDDDFLRLKTYIEKGKLPHDAAANTNSKRSKEMKVQEVMTKNIAVATLNTSLHDVAQMMADYDCGCIPVIEKEEDKRPLGMITDRDITLRTIAHNKNPLNMNASDVMTDNVITVTPELSIEDCILKMEKAQIRRVPVVDDAGNICGMVSQADIARKAPPFETAELVKDVSMAA